MMEGELRFRLTHPTIYDPSFQTVKNKKGPDTAEAPSAYQLS
jgi:hypothetical protein